MATTIQVKEPTFEMLKREKERSKASSYDEAIRLLFKKSAEKSMAGALARKKTYSTEELLKGLRDEDDRV